MTRVRLPRRTAMAGAALLGALALAGCGVGGNGHDMAGGHAAAASPGVTRSGEFNEADVMFAQMMAAHHQQAVEMGTLAETRAADPELKALAAQIKAAQGPEIAAMTGWLTSWGRPTAPAGGHGGHAMPGMMSDAEMTDLAAAQGVDFDRRYARMMIAHHNGAIQMSREELQNGSNPEARALADRIVASQQAEVGVLQTILDRL